MRMIKTFSENPEHRGVSIHRDVWGTGRRREDPDLWCDVALLWTKVNLHILFHLGSNILHNVLRWRFSLSSFMLWKIKKQKETVDELQSFSKPVFCVWSRNRRNKSVWRRWWEFRSSSLSTFSVIDPGSSSPLLQSVEGFRTTNVFEEAPPFLQDVSTRRCRSRLHLCLGSIISKRCWGGACSLHQAILPTNTCSPLNTSFIHYITEYIWVLDNVVIDIFIIYQPTLHHQIINNE